MQRFLLPGLILLGVMFGAACASQADLDASQEQVTALESQLADAEREVATLNVQVSSLSRPIASGGGVNLKMMPDPITGEPTSRLEEVFTFDRSHAICRVDTNPTAFAMPTHEMGTVVVEPSQFFMSMVATTVETFDVETLSDGTEKVTMTGGLDCATEVGQATVTFGSRTAAERATYRIEAIDGGFGGGEAGDSFAFTVFFDKTDAPVNYAIFGPEFTFTGQMVEGEITIENPRD